MFYKEGRSSTFTNQGKEYLVDDAIALSLKEPIESFRVDELAWIFEHSEPDQRRVQAADLEYPVLVIQEYINGVPHLVVIDGLHRLAKAKSLGRSHIKGRLINIDNLKALEKSVKKVWHRLYAHH